MISKISFRILRNKAFEIFRVTSKFLKFQETLIFLRSVRILRFTTHQRIGKLFFQVVRSTLLHLFSGFSVAPEGNPGDSENSGDLIL